jgi:hypothetical protein
MERIRALHTAFIAMRETEVLDLDSEHLWIVRMQSVISEHLF